MRFHLGSALLSTTLAAPAVAEADFLLPVDWVESGIGSLDGSDPILVRTLCREQNLSFPGTGGSVNHRCPGAAGDTAHPGKTFPATGSFELDFGQGGVFRADLVSEISGNTWTVGLRNLSFPTGLFTAIGDMPTQDDRLLWLRLEISADSFARFVAPGLPGEVKPVVFRRLGAFPRAGEVGIRSEALGDFGGLGLDPVQSLVAGDWVTLFTEPSVEFEFVLIAEALVSPDNVVTEHVFTTTTLCGTGGLEDCTGTLELFTPDPDLKASRKKKAKKKAR